MNFAPSIVDVIAFILVSFLMFRGSRRGILKEISSILRLFVAFVIAVLFYERLAVIFQAAIGMPSWFSEIICFSVVFLPISIMLWTISIIVQNKLSDQSTPIISSSSRMVGIVFGLLRGILIVSIALMVINIYAARGGDQSLIGDTISYRTVGKIAPGIKDFTDRTITHRSSGSKTTKPDENQEDNQLNQ